jgi:hypothetical protein
MKTENLIRVLAADASRPVIGIRALMIGALGIGAALSLVLFRLVLEPRADMADAIHGPGLALKLAVVLLLAVTAGGLLAPVARPLPTRTWPRLGLAPLLLAVAVIIELAIVPPGDWPARVLGPNVVHCLGSIPLLSAPPALCLFFAMRRGAPASASRAGAIAGLAAGGVGACLYALACPEDSSLFVALWYTLAIGTVTALCSVAGRRWLRW